MKKLSAVIVVLVVVILVLWLVLRGDRAPDDAVTTEPESRTTDSATSVTDAAPEEDGAAVAGDDETVDDETVGDGTVDDEATDAVDGAPEDDGAAVAANGDDDGTMTAAGTDDATIADDDDGVMEEDAGPDFDVVRVEASGDAVIAGVAEPGAAVVVTSGDNVVGETVADDSGSWVIVTETPLDPGAHTLRVESGNGHGEIMQSDTVVVVAVPQEPLEGETGDVLTVMMNDENSGEVEVIQGADEGIGISGGGALSLDSISYDEEGNVSMGGKATAGDMIVVYVDGDVAGVADVADGEWTIALEEPVDEGTHSLRVDEVNEAGDVVARLETPFVRSVFTMPDASDRLVVIQPGNNLWRIARRTYGSGVLYTLIYEANRNQIADPDLIYPGQIFVMPRDMVVEN